MGKIRVQDLARKIGMTDQDLIFKLRSIGVRVEGKDAHVDTDVLRAVLEGKKVSAPREVIVRDEEGGVQVETSNQRQRGRRGGPPPRSRRKTTIHKVDAEIPTLPAAEKPESREEPTAEERELAEVARKAQEKKKKAKSAEEAAERRAKREPGEDEEDLRAYGGEIEAETEGEDGEIPAKRRERKTAADRVAPSEEPTAPKDTPVTIVEGMTVRDFADKLGMKAKDLMKKLFERGLMANINQVVGPELAEELAEEMGYEVMRVSFEEEVQLSQAQSLEEETGERQPRAPVVTIMGHVDHGKTTLLDSIRESRVVESEHGGITQHIGAYQVSKNGRKIVFLDTPGHEAFTQLRARGATATDLVVLVVAADDGVMPQTVEAIDHARAADVPIVVAMNKIDKANANPDKVKTELSERGLVPEDWGGDTVVVPVSALEKEGIPELLEMVLLNAELLELTANPDLPAQGVVLEARKETGRGTVATVLVQNGTLRAGDAYVAGATWGRVRSMIDDVGERLDEAPPATPVEVTGFQEIPEAGDVFQVVTEESKAREIAEFRKQEQRRRDLAPAHGKLSLDQLFDKIETGEVKELPVVVKAGVQGSVEVLRDTLTKLSTEKVKVEVIHGGVGAISTNDVLLASASDAIVVGFNVRPERKARELAEKEGVEIRLYTVIYELTDDIRSAMVGLLEPVYDEIVRGRAEVREIFSVPRVGTVAGCHVVDGVIPRNAEARLMRDNRVVYEGEIASLKRFQDDASEVRAGFDCGIALENFQDIKPGDEIEAFVQEERAPSLE